MIPPLQEHRSRERTAFYQSLSLPRSPEPPYVSGMWGERPRRTTGSRSRGGYAERPSAGARSASENSKVAAPPVQESSCIRGCAPCGPPPVEPPVTSRPPSPPTCCCLRGALIAAASESCRSIEARKSRTSWRAARSVASSESLAQHRKNQTFFSALRSLEAAAFTFVVEAADGNAWGGM